jgi:hypothetical protein
MFPPTNTVPFCALTKLVIAKAAIIKNFFIIWVLI